MQKAAKFFMYLAMVSMACLLSGLTLAVLQNRFPSNEVLTFESVEVWFGPQEGQTLLRIGFLGFFLSSIVCIALSIIQKIRGKNSSA